MDPEQKARKEIDVMLAAAGWTVQDRNRTDLGAAQGVAIREFPLSILRNVEDITGEGCRRADRLRQSTLKRTFEGKLVPQDPTDEPAEKLLERIKTERTKTAPRRTRRARRTEENGN